MKHSIARQMAAVFIGLMVLVLAANLAVNGFFLERYYIVKFEKVLIDAYRLVDAHITAEGTDTVFFEGQFAQMITSNNLNVVVVDTDYNIVLRTKDGTSEIMSARIWGYFTGQDTNEANVLKKTDRYTIQKKTDQRMNMGFLEMWGTLSCGYYFMMRTPLQNIATNVKISNEFILYFSIIAVLVSILLIVWISRKIARPIAELTQLSKRMAALDFDARYTSGGENEIGVLGQSFNQMSEKLEETISQLKGANAQLQQDIEKKTRIDEMRKEFLANVSHELKTPLALIQGYAEGLKECINDDAESREFYCDVIIDESGKMNSMVKKLLELNQLEFGNQALDMQRFDIVQMIAGKLQSLQVLAQQKEARISYEGPEALHVWGDEFQLEEVLNNYISNALNHVDGERRIDIRAHASGGRARISVFNTGQPIPEEDIDKIWIKFYKVDKARTREYGGSGVGLSIVKAIMDAHGGAYGAKNSKDGVTFWFELDSAEGGNDQAETTARAE